MRHILFAIVLAMLPAWAMAAEQPRQQPRKPAAAPAPVKSNPCAIYGAGFGKLEGTSTCVKMGGSVTIDVGGKVGR